MSSHQNEWDVVVPLHPQDLLSEFLGCLECKWYRFCCHYIIGRNLNGLLVSNLVKPDQWSWQHDLCYWYLETVLFCDGENAQETLPTPGNCNNKIKWILLEIKPEVVVSDGSIIFLTGRVENVNLNFLPIEHHLCIFISFRFCNFCIRICVQYVNLNFFSIKQNLCIKFNGDNRSCVEFNVTYYTIADNQNTIAPTKKNRITLYRNINTFVNSNLNI